MHVVRDDNKKVHPLPPHGLSDSDLNWVTPDGRDVTAYCDQSSIGGFSGLYKFGLDFRI